MDKKTENILLVVVIFVLIVFLTFEYIIKTDPYYLVMGDKKNLQCLIKGKGLIKIPKEKIITYIEDKNIWVFTNGYAKNCQLIDK